MEINIDHIKKGDRKAFKHLFDQYFRSLCAFAYNYLHDVALVEDMVQESFLGFWEVKNDFDHINAVKSYLYTSVRNKCINQLKHKQVAQKHEGMLAYEIETESDTDQYVVEEETFRQLHQEIKNLPSESQKIMLLALNGKKNPQIAEELGISVNTVKTQKKIAYARLKQKLKPVQYLILLSL